MPTRYHSQLHHFLAKITESLKVQNHVKLCQSSPLLVRDCVAYLYKLGEVVHVLDADASHGVRLLVEEELLHYDVVG